MPSSRSPTARSQNYHKNKKWNNKNNNKSNNNSNIVPTNYPGKDEDTTMEDQSTDEERESGLTFRSMVKNNSNYDQCKYLNKEDFSKAPQDVLKTESFYLPITIEGIQTWGILDTGCTFSIISLHLSNFLKLSINKNHDSSDKILLRMNNHSITRIGTTRNGIAMLYNSIDIKTQLEVMDMEQRLAFHWDDNTLPGLLNPIDTYHAKPTESPYGTKEQRKAMTNKLIPFIKANMNISPTAHWAFNSPLFFDKQNGKSEYDNKTNRVIIDPLQCFSNGLVNVILLVSR
ncbi:unnamed protein product [Mucor hiemalis]